MERGCWIPGFKNITERMSLFRVKKIPFVGFSSSYPGGRTDLQTLVFCLQDDLLGPQSEKFELSLPYSFRPNQLRSRIWNLLHSYIAKGDYICVQPLPVNVEPIALSQIGDTDAEGERKRFWQTQQMLDLDLVGGAGPQEHFKQPELEVEGCGRHLPRQEEMSL